MPFAISRVSWSTHNEQLRSVRERVFIVEQQVPREIEWDGEDERSVHFLATDERGGAIGTARLMPTGQIGRIAVLVEHRRSGVGRQLLDLAVAEAERTGLRHVFLHAQSHAVRFYEKAGFAVSGSEFIEAGIAHIEMMRDLDITFVADPGTRSLPIENRATDVEDSASDRVIPFNDERTAREQLFATIEGAKRQLDIQSPTLDHTLFDSERVATRLLAVARRHPASRVRILIDDPGPIVARGHRLLDLARKLPSKIEIRRSNDEPTRESTNFVIADGTALWLLRDASAYVGWRTAYGPARAQSLLRVYVPRFEHAAFDPEFRLLGP